MEKAKGYDAALVESLVSEHGVTLTRPDKSAFMEVVAPLQVQLADELDLTAEYELLSK